MGGVPQWVAFRKCRKCGSKMPTVDPHDLCLLCLGEGHRTDKCCHCLVFSKQARKNRENRLRKLLWDQVLLQLDRLVAKPPTIVAPPEGRPTSADLPQCSASSSIALPSRPSEEGASSMANQPVSLPRKQKEKRKHSDPEKHPVHKKAKKDKAGRHAWLRICNFPEEMKQRIEEMLFDGSGLFNVKTDSKFKKIHESRMMVRHMELQSQPRYPLKSRLPTWESITSDGWVLSIIQHGYRIEFDVVPSLNPIRFTPTSLVLLDEIRQLLAKGAVRCLSLSEGLHGFYSRYFTVPKRDGGLRPTLDLRGLNRFITPKKLWMTTLQNILPLLGRGDWSASLDLKDAYFHISIHPRHRCFLRFAVASEIYEFKVLPFGLATAPRVFTKCMAPVCAHLRLRGIRIYLYLDDWLLVSKTKEGFSSAVDATCALLQDLGLCINQQKSSLLPTQTINFIGTWLDSTVTRVFLPQDGQHAIARRISDSTRRDCSCPIYSKPVGTHGSIHCRGSACQTLTMSSSVILQRDVPTTERSTYQMDSAPILRSTVPIMADRTSQFKCWHPILTLVPYSDSRVFQLISLMDAQLPRCSNEKVELAVLWFLDQFRKTYVGDQLQRTSKVLHVAHPCKDPGRAKDPVFEAVYVKAATPVTIPPPASNPGEAVAILNWCLAEVMGWMRANKLKLNPDKTEVLLVGDSSSWVGDLGLALDGVALPLKDRVHSLGLLLDPELSLEAQVTAVARSAFLQLRLIHQLRHYLEEDCLATVTHALVTSRLDFCNALYVGLPLKTVWILQMVQNGAARMLLGTGRYSHITPVLFQLHWLPIEVRAQFKVLVITYKALNGLGPGYLKEHLLPYLPSHPLRSAAEALLRKPSVKDTRQSTWRRAFSAVAP
ncbi:Ran-binding protein 17 [Varanus komodoensis]|nr:Ran-binding protein 17 [Varanus komodoensis]